MTDTSKTRRSEHIEQREFVEWFRKTYPGVLIFAIPNGGKRGAAAAAKLQLEGVVPGVPDLCVPEWHLWIEMKRSDGGIVGTDQKKVMGQIEDCGYTCVVAWGDADAREKVQAHARWHGYGC